MGKVTTVLQLSRSLAAAILKTEASPITIAIEIAKLRARYRLLREIRRNARAMMK
jgi:hypothetical protein